MVTAYIVIGIGFLLIKNMIIGVYKTAAFDDWSTLVSEGKIADINIIRHAVQSIICFCIAACSLSRILKSRKYRSK